MPDKPQNLTEYKEWLKVTHKVVISRATENHYKSVTTQMERSFSQSDLWKDVVDKLGEFNAQYLRATDYSLLPSDRHPELHIKPFQSFLHKTFRKNVLHNERWPEPPTDGWVLPENWFCRINDILRTLFVVKYLDGVQFLVERISNCAATHEHACQAHYEAREEGYYAAHVSISATFEIPRLNWDTEWIETQVELQITTQLQEVIRRLLHKYYERERQRPIDVPRVNWQWNYESEEFITNYLGHILHYVEGMIMEIRKRQGAGAKNA